MPAKGTMQEQSINIGSVIKRIIGNPMTAGRIWKRHLLSALFGAILLLVLVPAIRLLILDYSFVRAAGHLDKKVPGLALADLLRVEPWSSYHPNYQRKLSCEKIRCYVRLGLMSQALSTADMIATESLPETRPTLDVWEQALTFPYRGLGRALQQWPQHTDLTRDSGYAILREELEAGGHTKALAALDRVQMPTGDPDGTPTAPETRRKAMEQLTQLDTSSITSAEPTTHTPTPTSVTPPAAQSTQGWGISITEEARIYNTQGKFIRRLPPGKLLNVLDEKDADGIGRLFTCTAYPGGSTHFLIRVSDVEYYAGDIAAIDPDIVDMLVTRISLEGRIKQRILQLQEEAKSRNPHFAAYDQSRNEYRDFSAESKRLTKLRDDSTGQKRITIGAKLNEMMSQGASLDRRYRAAKKQYDLWNASHATTPNIDQDARIQQMREQQRQIEAKLQGVVSING